MAMPRINRGNESASRIAANLGAAGRTQGSNPGTAPQRGLTQPGVVEAFIAGTMGAASLKANPGPLPLPSLPISDMK